MEEVVKHRIDSHARDVYDCQECGVTTTVGKVVDEMECPRCKGEGGFDTARENIFEMCDLCDGEGLLQDQVVDSDVVRFCPACGVERWQFDIGDKVTVTMIHNKGQDNERKDALYGETVEITKVPDPQRFYLVMPDDGRETPYSCSHLQYEEVD